MRKNRILGALCAALFALSAAGCSKPNPADTDAVNAALDKFRACSSFSLVQVTQLQETVTEGEQMHSYSSTIEMEISLITTPALRMKTSTSVKHELDGGLMEQSGISYILPENMGYAEYFTDGGEWLKVSTEDVGALSGFNANSVASSFFVDRIAFRRAGEETLDSGKAVRYEGDLGGTDLVAMLESIGYLNSISSMSENQQTRIKENLARDLDAVTVKVWVDEASGYPVRFEVSISDMLKDLEKSIAKTLGEKSADGQGGLTGYVIRMTVRDFDAVPEILLPPEAAAAQPYKPE